MQKKFLNKKMIFTVFFLVVISFSLGLCFQNASASSFLIFLNDKQDSIKCYPKGGYIKYKGEKYYLVTETDKVIIDMTAADIDNNMKEDILIIEGKKDSEYGDNLIIYETEFLPGKIKLTEKYRNNLTAINPWTIKICNIDNDSEPEIFIGTYKETVYYPGLENRPFFFNYRDNKLVKKWTGSKLRAPFKDICFGDLNDNGSDELIVIEELEEDKNIISVYYWFGFGFILYAESSVYKNIEFVETEIIDGKLLIKTDQGYLELSADKSESGVYLLKER
ncbi:MAG TPA: hypothetical protein PLC16_08325 [Defluviitaleaceae bacterium]|nr:hypothetical protein [Defluviitaleaceae bacterium]HPT76714.1 hypothetical protein [Defluviitaleaceae bacterium]